MRWTPLLLTLALVACTGRPVPPPGEATVAVAFRDAVPGYQRVGTRGFSVHYLERAYDQVVYLEQDALGAETHAAFVQALRSALESNRRVDLFLLVNGGRQVDWVAEVPAELRRKLRLVYNTGAGGGTQEEAWSGLGVGAYVSHPGWANLAPFFYVDFLRNWAAGQPLESAVGEANRTLHDRLSGFSAPLLLKAAGFNARPEDLPFWEAATRARIRGDGSLKVAAAAGG